MSILFYTLGVFSFAHRIRACIFNIFLYVLVINSILAIANDVSMIIDF